MKELIDQLCQRLGIDPGFYDYQGNYHIASDDVCKKLISALGYKADTSSAARKLIKELDEEIWIKGLPPVAVLHQHWDKAIEIYVPRANIKDKAYWQIRFETGQIIEEPFVANKLECLGEKTVGGRKIYRYRLHFPNDLPLGYHQLYIRFASRSEIANKSSLLIVTPKQCYCPMAVKNTLATGRRLWGLSVQLYSVRSRTNWGIGDYGDLKRLVAKAAKHGADFIGLNPLHALFYSNPRHKSPYSPSSRLFLNYLYLEIPDIIDFAESQEAVAWLESDETQQILDNLRLAKQVNYVAVAAIKQQALHYAYQSFRNQHIEKRTRRARRFYDYVERGGTELLKQAIFDAMYSEQFKTSGELIGWQHWPEIWQDSDGSAVKKFHAKHTEQIEYFQYLQWLCAEQLEAAQETALAAGMCIGLYRDLAVSVEPNGAEAWGQKTAYSFQARVGAPPDPLALQGQNWGLPPLNPRRLQRNGYDAFIKVLRANMQSAGALRIDHVMALLRLWWVPRGSEANEGAYVYYPLDDLLGILALESQRNRCLIIGEALGTVPEEIRSKLPAAGVYSYKVMYFEKQSDREFKRPEHYEDQAMATVSTHDLATLAGWWQGEDLELRDELALFPTATIRKREYNARSQDRQALLEILKNYGLISDDQVVAMNSAETAAHFPAMTTELSSAVHAFLGGSRAALMAIQVEDLLLMREQMNLPGTVDEHPNWCRKLSKNIEEWFELEATRCVLQEIDLARSQ